MEEWEQKRDGRIDGGKKDSQYQYLVSGQTNLRQPQGQTLLLAVLIFLPYMNGQFSTPIGIIRLPVEVKFSLRCVLR